ncbi:hypothetical protein Airi01_069020 [Actinoallomurus iriomotensis]|uniref:Tyr recombinase domain-containing protein n=1 Tax=Actinoallomurus iriomotensis TaxID=478107 RepID=A0A9W6VSF5_9ACTN|nr:hypothetical protein Airi01_069020 [Actinoallomurus iriomotensis]
MGVPGLHFHDLRHAGNTLAADMGVSLRTLMARMGHDNERAALIYQHASNQADRKIAEGSTRCSGQHATRTTQMTTGPPAAWSPWPNGTLMARRAENRLDSKEAQCRDHLPDLGLRRVEQNRTRTTSLGIVWFRAVTGADLDFDMTTSDRCSPWLMAR